MSEKEARIAFEHRMARQCRMSYQDIKQKLDEYESITGRRYGEHGTNHQEWEVWLESWQTAKQLFTSNEFLIVPKSLDINKALKQAELVFNRTEQHLQKEWSGISGREYELRKQRWIESTAIQFQVDYKICIGFVDND